MKKSIVDLGMVLLIIGCNSILGLAQAPIDNDGKDFWIAWPYTFYNEAEVIIQSGSTANVTMSGPALWTGIVSQGKPAIITLPGSSKLSKPSGSKRENIEDKGIHITSDTDISVIFRTPDGEGRESDDAYLAIPTSVLGKEYYVMSYDPVWISPSSNASFFVIVVVEDNTNIYISSGITNFTLNRGQTLQRISSEDLTGTFIRADKPIAVISGSRGSYIPPLVHANDNLLEEMIPVEKWGMDYYTAPLYSPKSGDQVRIIASEDGTVIDIDDGINISEFTLPFAGAWIELEVEPAVHITSQKPIFVVQYARGKNSAGVGDPFEMGIIPTDGFDTTYIFYTPPGYTEGNFATIISPEDETRVTLDGSVIRSGWYSLPGGGKYILVPISVGEHVIDADSPIGVYAHGYRNFGSYGYPAGFCFECSSPEDIPVNLPPVIDIGQDQTVFTEPEDEDGDALVLQTASISDPEGDIVEYSWSIDGVIVESGSIDTPDDGSPILITLEVEMKVTHSLSTLSLTVSDGINEVSDEAFITVIDATPPKMNLSVTPDILFPPNHKLVDIEVTIDIKDNADPNPSVVLISIACNEPDNTINGGDGNTTDDIQGVEIGIEDTEFLLRAERRGDGIERIYLITYTATDESGNSTTADAIVTVPHDMGRRMNNGI